MKALCLSLVMASLVLSPAAFAKSKENQTNKQGVALLKQALNSVAITASSDGPPARTVDNDQGDDHANAGAILRVCSKETPAARRSAICPVSASPE